MSTYVLEFTITIAINIYVGVLAIFCCFDARTKTSDMMTNLFHKAGMAWYFKTYQTSWLQVCLWQTVVLW